MRPWPVPDPAKMAETLQHLREGIQVVGPDWHYLYVNSAAAAHGRSTAETLIGRTMMDCYPGIEETEVFGLLRDCMQTGRPHQTRNEFTYPDGKVGWFELRIQRVPMGVVVLSVDVTEQRRLEQDLRHAMRMEALGQLAGGVAHDFNNLLTIITAYATLLADRATADDAEDLAHVIGAARRGAALTGQLLAFSRRKPVTPVALDPWTVACDVLDLSGVALGDRIEVVRRCEGPLPSVSIDPGALEQVVLNLVLNARDAMAGGAGRLVVEAREVLLDARQESSRGEPVPPGPYVVLSVSDTGVGMTREVLDRLFDPFFSTKGERGTGLGLSSSYGLVRQAGGYLSVYSEVGQGATFRIYLPALADRATTASPVAVATAKGTRGHETLLVVDDDPSILRVAVRVLAPLGYDVQAATSMPDALARLADGLRPELMITDVGLHGASGLELAARARDLQPGLRVLLMSGFTASVVGGSPEPWLEKPFSPLQLADRVRAVLDA